MGVALKAENVSIRYITGDFKDIGIKEYVVRRLTNNYHVNEFMAVDGVSFELESGDMLGIIGSNGAGKSTLLKAVAGIMEPTRGKITANGEVAALLELGSGFDGDLTVKENAYLRGAMLGYTKDFMDATYDQIIDFAELRDFEDRPFKQLSSGMKSRLAFSIASLVNPDILILDEVLSVGDGAFQEKSAKKMREIISQGATTILVSHSVEQIRELCNKVLWMDHGEQVAFGETQEICDQYERFLRGECPAQMPGEKRQVHTLTYDEAKIEPSRSDNPSNFHIYTFDMLKGIMCILISLYYFSNEYTPGGLFSNSFLCVEAFFAMSGYFLMQRCYKEGQEFDVVNILKQRISRLYPVYLIGVMALIGLFSIRWFSGNPFAWMASTEYNRSALLTELLGLQAIGLSSFHYINYPAWYVSALIVSSALMLLIFKRFRRKQPMFWRIMAVLPLSCYGILYFLDAYSASSGFLFDLPISLPLVRGVAGMCLGACIFRICDRADLQKIRAGYLNALMFVSTLGMLYIMVFVKPSRWNWIFLILLVFMMISAVGLAKQNKQPQIKPLLFLGKISYIFFVLHSFSQNVLSIYISPHTSSVVLLAVLFLTMNLAISCILHFILGRDRTKPRVPSNGEGKPNSLQTKSTRVTSIEGIRGILAVIIALFHFGQAYPIGSTFRRGYFAVEVFFLLSGFLLAKKIDKMDKAISPIKELTGRLKHLYPAYFISIVSLVMLYSATWFHWNPVSWILSEDSHFTSLITELLCIQVSGIGGLKYVNGPVWYVSALLLSTSIIILFNKLLPKRFFKAVIAMGTAVIYGLFFIYDPSMNSAGFFAGSRIPSPLLRGIAGLGLGCCLYWVYQKYENRNFDYTWLNYVSGISCLLMVLPLIWTEPGRSNYLLFLPASVCILSMFWLGDNGKFPILNSKFVQYMGKISYAFFVMQSFSQNFVSIVLTRWSSNHFMLTVMYLGVNFSLSVILHLLTETGWPAKVKMVLKNKNEDEVKNF